MARGSTDLLASLIAIGLLVLFVFLVGSSVVASWTATAKVTQTDTEIYWAEALAGVIGSFVATSFNVEPEQVGTLSGDGGGLIGPLKAVVQKLGSFLFVPHSAWRARIGTTYVVVFLLLALLTILTVAQRADVAPDSLKQLAAVSGGMFLAILRSYLGSIR